MSAGLDIRLAPRDAASGETLLLEQREWKASTGILTRAAAALYLDRLLYGDDETNPAAGIMDCGLTDGRLLIGVYVYPLADMPFRLAASIGDMGAPEYAEIEEEAGLNFEIADSASLSHPARRVLSAQWLTGPYNESGDKVAPPPMTVDGRTLRLSGGAVYGSVQVKLLVPRWTAILAVAWADAAASLNQGWGEHVVAYPSDAPPVALDLTAPPGAEEMAASGAECGNTFRGSIRRTEEDWPPIAEPKNKYVDCDYCKGECDDGYRP